MVVVNSDPARPDPKPQKPKRPISAAKHAACVANSRRSTGPTSPAGKATVSRNATKSGFTCRKITFLPGEDEQEFRALVDRCARDVRAETAVEYAEVEEAVYSRWKQRRIRESQAAAAHQRIETIEAAGDDRAREEVRTLIPQLPLEPLSVINKLRSTTPGCTFLLEQFRLLKAWLSTHHAFEVSQRRYTLQLLGRQPNHLFIDPVVFEIDRLYLGAIGGPGSFTAEQAANAFLLDRPDDMSDGEFARRLEPMVQNLPTIAEGHAALVRLVDQSIAELTERVELIGLREQRDRYLATRIALTDVTHEGELRERYDSMAGREHHASLREVRALQADRRKYGSGDCGELHDQEYPAETAERTAVPTPTEPAQNKATVPEVDGAAEEAEGPIDVTGQPLSPWERVPEGRVRADAPPSAAAFPGAADSPMEDEAIQAEYQTRLQRVLERLEPDPAATDHPPPGLETSA
jgi:hypothetical protein